MYRSGMRMPTLLCLGLTALVGPVSGQPYPSGPPLSTQTTPTSPAPTPGRSVPAVPAPSAVGASQAPSRFFTVPTGDPYEHSCPKGGCVVPPLVCVRDETTLTRRVPEYGCRLKVVCIPSCKKGCGECGKTRTVRVMMKRFVPRDRCDTLCHPVPAPCGDGGCCSQGCPSCLPGSQAATVVQGGSLVPPAAPPAPLPVMPANPPAHLPYGR